MKTLSLLWKGHRIELFDRPGAWMDDASLERLGRRLRSVARARAGEHIHTDFFKGRDNLARRLVVIASDRRTGDDIALSALSYLGEHQGSPVVHLGVTLSCREVRGLMQWLYAVAMSWLFWKHGFRRRIWFTSITHTPRIFGVVADYYEEVFPGLEPDARPAPFHLALRDMVLSDYVQRQRGTPEPPAVDERFVLPAFRARADGGAWLPDTPESVPRHRNPAYNERVLSMLDLARGDDVVQVGWMTGSSLIRTLFKARILKKG